MSANSVSRTMGRKRSYCKAGLLVASAVTLSFPCSLEAFQSSITSGCRRAHERSTSTLTQLGVVTDPQEMIRRELQGREGFDRQALEDMYLIATTDSDGLSGEMLEGAPSTRGKGKTKTKAKIKKTAPPPETEGYGEEDDEEGAPEKRVFFKGITTGPDRRFRRKSSSLSRTPPIPKSSEIKGIERSTSLSTSSKSSTMPGFSDRGVTGRKKAYYDGIKLAEQQSGKQFEDTEEQRVRRRTINGASMYKTSAAVPDSLVQFANEIHEVERITPKEEVALGEKTQEAIRLQNIYDGLEAKLDRVPTDEEWCAAAGKINMNALSQAIEEGLEAKNTLVTANLRMVQGVVNVYIRNGLRGQYNAGDLMQDGIMALIRAAEKFDPGRGFRFSTYAMYWIRSSIKRGQVAQSRVVAVPQRLYENHKRIQKVQSQIANDLGRPPTIEELASAVDMSVDQVTRCVSAMSQRCYSLDQTISNPYQPLSGSSREGTMYDLIESRKDDDSYSQQQTHSFLREDLIALLKQHLSEEEVHLLLLRYGLFDSSPQNLQSGPLTIAEVSRMVGYKPDKVRRIINRSLKHMKTVIGAEWIEYERELQ